MGWLRIFILLLIATGLIHSPACAAETTFLTHFIRPFTYKEHGEFKGFAVEIVREMMAEVDRHYPLKMFPFNRALSTARYQENTALFIVARRPEREEWFKWVGPLVTSGVYFYKRKDAPITARNLDDLKKLSAIGVGRGNADHTFLKSENFNNLIPANDQLLSLLMLCGGRVDVTPMSELVMPEMAKQAGIDDDCVENTGIKLYDSTLFMVFSRDVHDSEVAQWQQALDHIKGSGRYRQIYEKYIK